MSQRPLFASLRRVLVPAVHGCRVKDALSAALSLGGETVIAGFVHIGGGGSISAGAAQASELRRELSGLAGESLRVRARVRVSRAPWQEISEVVEAEDPDLLILNWPRHLEALGLETDEVLGRPPCDLALIRGPMPADLNSVLVPVRGGPHAELALRLALALRPRKLTVVHLTPDGGAGREVTFQGIERVLKRMPEVEIRYRATGEAWTAILTEARGYDLVLMGTAAPRERGAGLGPVAEQVLQQCPAAVIVVRTRRRMAVPVREAAASDRSISILVDKWFAENTYSASEFADLESMLRLKR